MILYNLEFRRMNAENKTAVFVSLKQRVHLLIVNPFYDMGDVQMFSHCSIYEIDIVFFVEA